jgi:molybdopterin converting factor small subunit
LATVVLQGDLARRCTGGLTALQVDAADYRELLARLDERFPALVEAIRTNIAVAIDGEIFQDPLLEPIGPDSEVHFMPLIGGGASARS